MTINDIEATLLDKIAILKSMYGASALLSDSQNTQATDDLASVLETVNPNHDYPPANK